MRSGGGVELGEVERLFGLRLREEAAQASEGVLEMRPQERQVLGGLVLLVGRERFELSQEIPDRILLQGLFLCALHQRNEGKQGSGVRNQDGTQPVPLGKDFRKHDQRGGQSRLIDGPADPVKHRTRRSAILLHDAPAQMAQPVDLFELFDELMARLIGSGPGKGEIGLMLRRRAHEADDSIRKSLG